MNQTLRLTRGSQFSYTCNRCRLCCHAFAIRVNPYEVARLAENQQISTSEFLERRTTDGGTLLVQEESGRCTFLGSEGCTVHPDRPLVCRLYPLGRHTGDGEEWFSSIAPQEGSLGVYGEDGTVQDFLDAQGTTPFIEAVERYNRLFARALPILKDARDQASGEAEAPDSGVPELLDMDAAVEAYCREQGRDLPKSVEAKMNLHLEALDHAIRVSAIEPSKR